MPADEHLCHPPGQPSFIVAVSGKVSLSSKELEEIINNLNRPKTPELEYYYDDLIVSDTYDNLFSYLAQWSAKPRSIIRMVCSN